MARVAVVGAGVVGVASAYLLSRAGHDVTLVGRNAGPALGASRAKCPDLLSLAAHGFGQACDQRNRP